MGRRENPVPEIFASESDAHRGDFLDGLFADRQFVSRRVVNLNSEDNSPERNHDNSRGGVGETILPPHEASK